MNNGIIQSAQQQSVQKTDGKRTMQSFIKSMEGQIAKALPSVLTPERFTRMVLTALSVNPKLGSCTPQSFLGAMMTAAQLGVEPNTALGQAYLIPFRNKGVMECQFQLGYKGLIDLAYRSGEVSLIQAHVVYENDEFTYELGLDPKLKHVPAKTNRGKAICYYAMFKTKDGGYGFEVMSAEDVTAHAKKYSKSYSSGPWQTNFDEMAKKTVLKRVLKYAPLKSDFAREIAQDETVKTEISSDMYEVPSEPVFEAEYTDLSDEQEGADA
ncbi:MAG: recombinase RecT [Clostridia bacterium]|nr:recombinase RecT [Clostridia bacterium]